MIRIIFVVGMLTAGALPALAQADQEKARQWAHSFKEQYWQCLANETERMLPRKISAQDFSLFIKGACPTEAQKFRVALVDYLAMKFPDIAANTHLSAADNAISLAQADVVKTFIELKSGAGQQR